MSHDFDHTYRLDDTRSPWVTRTSSPPCRPHTPWCDGGEPCAFASIVQARPFPIFGRPVHPGDASPRLRPGGSPQALQTPPRGGRPALRSPARGWLQVPLGCVRLSPLCPYTVLHTCLSLRPVRHYPHLWIAARGLGPSGTLTRLRRVLPGTHYGTSDVAECMSVMWPPSGSRLVCRGQTYPVIRGRHPML